MTSDRFSQAIWAAVLLVLLFQVTGCANARYHQPDRQPVTAAQTIPLPARPRAQHIICPRGNWDRLAQCPWGEEFAGYDSDAVDKLTEYFIAAQANLEIAQGNAAALAGLEGEAAAANLTAAQLEYELRRIEIERRIERIGWMGSLGLVLWLAL